MPPKQKGPRSHLNLILDQYADFIHCPICLGKAVQIQTSPETDADASLAVCLDRCADVVGDLVIHLTNTDKIKAYEPQT